VWYAPIADLGTTAWPVEGFIYPDGKATAPRLEYASHLVSVPTRAVRQDRPAPRRDVIGDIIRAAG
jgi:hypothetical protein